MAVYDNQLTRAGDFLVFTTRLPLVGVVRVDDFTDDVVGETAVTYFDRKISYSIDGIFFTPWLPLNTTTLRAIDCPEGHLWVNYLYTRTGANTDTPLEFNYVILTGEFKQPVCQTEYALPRSIFRDFFCHNPEQLSMCAHLTKKLYYSGVIPKYISRQETDEPQIDDEDYIALWSSISCFFALIILFGQQFENISKYPIILKEYLRQHGLLFGQKASSLQLDHLRRNKYSVAALRGTIEAICGAENADQTVLSELLSLIDIDLTTDEYSIGVLDKQYTGYTIGQSGPMFRGTRNNYALNKAYEKFVDITDLSKYPILQPEYVSIKEVVTRDGQTYSSLCIKDVAANKISGIGGSSVVTTGLLVDKYTDYEISFCAIRKDFTKLDLQFGLRAYDAAGNPVNLTDAKENAERSNDFSKAVKFGNDQTAYQFQGTLYGCRTNAMVNVVPFDVEGNNLRMTESVYKIIPQIRINNLDGTDITGEVYIWDLRIAPLKTKYSLGFVQSGGIVQAWLKNRNSALTNTELDKVVKRQLIPYNLRLEINYLYDVYHPDYIGKFRAKPIVINCTTPANNDGQISLQVLGGLDPYSYLWSTSEVTDSIENLVPGLYSVLITDSLNPIQRINLVNIEVKPYRRPTAWRPRIESAYCE
jgi:hypothetical protein